jgi:hypothetical protein
MTSKKNHKLSLENCLETRKDGESSSKEGGIINSGRNFYQQKKIRYYEKQ